ncbi:helix-turn-helix domain-containing protein [Weissella bombi]|uniref:Helix-turn-helix domain-containing protein n=1 Tax=Weissella bombi TaxID=1505725 RepID=A0A1C4C6X7_9LACO|nr:helix-turn-helix domain-containing protein [Weissella bombi]SCC14867.1 Helix-turn-helix domain-containing protein [Weissella bombi]
MTTFERIKKTAKERGLTLNQLNEKAKLKNNIIYSWKTKTPSVENIKKVAGVLGVSVDYLLGNTDEMHANKKSDKVINLDEALSEKGVVMKFQGKELSDKAKRGILEILDLIDGDEE